MIAKIAPDDRAYQANVAAAAYLEEVGLQSAGPRLLARIDSARLLVMEELSGASLADLLLGSDAVECERALLAHAELLGDLAAATLNDAQRFERLGGPPPYSPHELLGGFGSAASIVMDVSQAASDLLLLEEFWRGGPRAAFSPGDTCPDNNAWSGGRLRLFDFDFAGFQHAALAYSYFDVSWPTCWCVARLPAGCAQRLRDAFLERCAVTDAEAAMAAAFWAVFNLGVRLPRALEEDAPISPRSPARFRQMLVWRSREAAARLGEAGALPRLRDTLDRLAHALAHLWDEPGILPSYPAFN